MSKSIYFIGIVPPEKISQEIIAFQKEIEKRFAAKHAQKVAPHITVIPPFECTEEQIIKFINKLGSHDFDEGQIEIKLTNFQTFEQRTLFVDVSKNEALTRFCKKVKWLFNKEKLIPQRIDKHFFVPHITIANKDLKKRDFKIASNEFKSKSYHRNFRLQELILFKLDRGVWMRFLNCQLHFLNDNPVL